MPPSVDARPASSVMLVRPADDGPEVLMVKRPDRGFFGGLMVFPGGAVDDCDVEHVTDSELRFRVAGLRETAEEVGILITGDGFTNSPPLRGGDLLVSVGRKRLEAGSRRLGLVSRWVTPTVAPKRFDTRFYLAGIEGDPEIVLDTNELIGHVWVKPTTALAHANDGEWPMILPTIAHLRWLRRFASVEGAVEESRAADGLTIIEPVTLKDGSFSARYRVGS